MLAVGVEVATTFPFASVERRPLVIPENQVVPKVVSDDEAFWRFNTLVKVEDALKIVKPEKVVVPAKVLLSINSVEEAATALVLMQVPLTAKQPVARLMPPPKVEVALVAMLSAPVMVVEAPT